MKQREFDDESVSLTRIAYDSNVLTEIVPPAMPHSAAKPGAGSLTVYFDGGCPVCSREIAAYRRQTGAQNCVWVDASSCPEPSLGSGLSTSDAMARFHVRRADGQLVVGMRAFALLWLELPRMAWAGRVASMGPMPLLLDGAYRVFLALRPLWRAMRPATAPRSVDRSDA